MAKKLTTVDVYTRVASNIGSLSAGVITIKQCRDRIARLAKSATEVGITLAVPSTVDLRAVAPVQSMATVATVTIPAQTDTDYDYESSEEVEPEVSYEESYESSSCW
jgi:hypothetical protein